MAKNKVPIYKIIADEITTRIYEGVYSLNSYLLQKTNWPKNFTSLEQLLEKF